MARGFRRRPNAQYGWATAAQFGNYTSLTEIQRESVVVGGSDISVLSTGGTHVNLKRLIADVTLGPLLTNGNEQTVEELSTTGSYMYVLSWAFILVDSDDDTDYSPDSQDILADERIVAHGQCFQQNTNATVGVPGGAATVFAPSADSFHMRIDVKSNRRITVDENLTWYASIATSRFIADAQDVPFLPTWQLMARALLKFP